MREITSRWRRICMASSLRSCSRYPAYSMPCEASASGRSASLMLFCVATSLSALFSVSSETLMPARLARWICSSCSTRRSSTCCRITFCGRQIELLRRMRLGDDDHLLVELARSTTPSLTVAATRSSSTPELEASRVCANAPALRKAQCQTQADARKIFSNHGVDFPGHRGFPGVTSNCAFQESVGRRSDTG